MLKRETLSDLMDVSPLDRCVAIKPGFYIRLKRN